MLEKVGNLGQVQLMLRLLAQKSMEGHDKEMPVMINKEEYKALEQMLSDFHYVLSNLHLNENSLRNGQFGGLVRVLDDMKKKDYL